MSSAKQTILFNRELSWLEFNNRVLNEAMDTQNPLLERLKFLGIVSSNLDEFFMVRVASQDETHSDLKQIYTKAFRQMEDQYKLFTEEVLPELEKAGINYINAQTLSPSQLSYVSQLFEKEIMPLLTPIRIGGNIQMPMLTNLSLYLFYRVEKSAKESHLVLMELPKHFPRVIRLTVDKGYGYILIEEIIHLFCHQIFEGYSFTSLGLFRLTRAAELQLNETNNEDFAKVMTKALLERKWGEPVRLEYLGNKDGLESLVKVIPVEKSQIFQHKRWIELNAISQIAFESHFNELKDEDWPPIEAGYILNDKSFWVALKQEDILLHCPYQDYQLFLDFLQTAVEDPDVLIIKQTLYRTYKESKVVRLLEEACRRGKKVTVMVELKARFDEERNIEWAGYLEKVGATVLYGIANYKVHAKACLIVRREAEGLMKYVHLSTGNYNEKTARLYSDLSLFSSHPVMTQEIATFFNVITGVSDPFHFNYIEMAPFGLKNRLLSLIQRESLIKSERKQAHIILKMNSLVDADIIHALYEASKNGVKIQLNIRGVCCLIPGKKGLSENIEVRSVVDRFLEHSRIFYFENGGENEIFLSSADCMPRNLERRVELLFSINGTKQKNDIKEILGAYFKDNVKAWNLNEDGTYEKIKVLETKKWRAQEYLYQYHKTQHKNFMNFKKIELKPQKPKKSL